MPVCPGPIALASGIVACSFLRLIQTASPSTLLFLEQYTQVWSWLVEQLDRHTDWDSFHFRWDVFFIYRYTTETFILYNLQRYKTTQNNKQLVYLALFGDFLCVWFSFFTLPALILFLVCLLYLCKCWDVQRERVRVDFNVSCESFMINSGGNTDIV